MSKKPGKDLVEARVIAEEDWTLEAFRARLTFADMRRRAILPVDQGGLGYSISEHGLRSLLAAARKRHGEAPSTREEKVERQGHEIDARARLARRDLEAAYRDLAIPPPTIEEAGYDVELYKAETASHWKRREAAVRLIESADRRLDAVMKHEANVFGLNAPTRIEADVTTHDAVMDDLNAALVALGREPVESETQ